MNSVSTEIVCIIDRSGSMDEIRHDAIGGFNRFLTSQQSQSGDARLTLVLFDHEYEVVCDGVNIRDAHPLDEKTYVPRGTTALFDAIGRAIRTVDARLVDGVEASVIVCVLTDGQENASKEYRPAQIRELIREHRTERGWEFVFLAANQDAFTAAEQLSIDRGSAVGFAATGAGVDSAFTSITNIVSGYRRSTKGSGSDGSGGLFH